MYKKEWLNPAINSLDVSSTKDDRAGWYYCIDCGEWIFVPSGNNTGHECSPHTS